MYTASLSGGKFNAMEELDASSSKDNGVIATRLNQIKRWLLSHSQHMNFFTILVLASVSYNSLFSFHSPMFWTKQNINASFDVLF